MANTDGFDASWAALAPGARRCPEPAHRAWLDGGLPVGAVLTDADGVIVAEGRNRAYDPPGGTDPLHGTPLAHAELNALARTGWDLAVHTLWSSHQPCGMCAAAAGFTGVGVVRFLAPDPWAVGGGRRARRRGGPRAARTARLAARAGSTPADSLPDSLPGLWPGITRAAA
ncbi:deaminase [Kitasatospora sp. NPDC091207]|uniref:deaminase n=1 Tax=Kitasatospora sp. NPDC091207 TaxID=3364083 RepID=UPI003824C806